MSKLNLREYAEQLADANEHRFMIPVIEKELLHYEILRVLSERGILSTLTFQGGTCLRLCYGAARYSEDLDFAGGLQFAASDLNAVKSVLEKTLPEKYQVSVRVADPADDGALVKKWRIRIDTTVGRPDLANQKITFEVASIPAYTRTPRLLQLNYEGIPSSYGDIIVQAETPDEIMADKLESFICSSHVRYRDIWDLFWLMRRPGINIEAARQMRAQKAVDYGEVERFADRLPAMIEQLPGLIEGVDFRKQMQRFLPSDDFQRSVAQPQFRALMLEGIQELYA